MSTKQKQPHHVRNIFIGILVVLLVIPLMLYLYNLYLDHADQQKFVVLKQDMVALQKDFTMIDSGWKYEEWCTQKGGKYEFGASACDVEISRESSFLPDRYINKLESLTHVFSVRERKSFTADDGLRYQSVKLDYVKNSTVICDMVMSETDGTISGGTLRCVSSARDFYYPKIP